MFKRGISPLIATVLIIGFTVALGAVVILWGGDFVRSMQESAESSAARAETCAAAMVELTNIEQSTPSTLDFLLENDGSADVESVVVRVTGDVGADSVSVRRGLKSAAKRSFHVNFDAVKVGSSVSRVEVIPVVSVGGKSEPCAPGVGLEAEGPSAEDVSQWDLGKGNGVIDSWEECDSSGVLPVLPGGGTVDCASFGYSGEGSGLVCTEFGTIDVSGCADYGGEGATTCGNNALDTVPEEGCDNVDGNPAFIAGIADCVGLDAALVAAGEDGFGFTGGTLYCAPDCGIDISQCTTEIEVGEDCGNGAIDAGEQCDGDATAGETCMTQGLGEGVLGCTASCTFDTSQCSELPICNNDIKEGAEVCDGSDLGGETCVSQGFDSGVLGCNPTCSALIINECVGCGDGEVDGDDQCDGSDLGGATCVSQGFALGTLACKSDCTFDTSQCVPLKTSQVSSNNGYTCALMNNGNVYCWGWNYWGQLGDGTKTNSYVPKKINGFSDVIQVATCYTHTCALKSNGDVYCWGSNANGRLGDGTIVERLVPTRSLMSGATQVTCGESYTCALKSNGDVYCWGLNGYGQLGDGTTTSQSSPKKSLMVGAVQLESGEGHVCALNNVNELYCWGSNLFGSLADGTYTDRSSPFKVSITGMSKVSAGFGTTCVLKTNGEMWCWGRNNRGQSGIGSLTPDRITSPMKNLMVAASGISAGVQDTCAVSTTNNAYCWGWNTNGEVGDGTKVQKTSPVNINLPDVVSINMGQYEACAVKINGDLYCWGYNFYGGVGDGTTTTRLAPVKVTFT